MANTILERIAFLEQKLHNMQRTMPEIITSIKSVVNYEGDKKWKTEETVHSPTNVPSMITALCIDTVDPWKQGRVRYYTPLLHDPQTPIKSLPFAMPISNAGGFDDCGMVWVPPAGSTLCLLFEAGSRLAPFYIGTTWHRNRGPQGQRNWGFNIQEFYDVSDGHRKGYMVGADDESQVFPPWNTETYNGYDIDSETDYDMDINAQNRITAPNIYGFKTPEKHTWKNTDGNYRCGRKWKRMEFISSCGNYMIFKDDHLHPSGQWGNPELCDDPGDEEDCAMESTPADCTVNPSADTKCSNPFFKHRNEGRPIVGPGTPQNNKLDLDQTGIQLLSISGHSMVFDDSVDEPRGDLSWERSMDDFDFGCSDIFTGKFYVKSATGHLFEMNDLESDSNVRGDQNRIRLMSAAGNRIDLCDHTVGASGCNACPPNLAGEKRGITMQTTSEHVFRMIDQDNEQCSPCRMEGGVPVNKAKNGYIQLRSGYGLELTMVDNHSQQETQNQFIQILAPQTDNEQRGPHIQLFQEASEGPGEIYLRAGGNYVIQTYDTMFDQVGDPDTNPSDKYTYVTANYDINTVKMHYHRAEEHLFLAEKQIILLGECTRQDCGGPTEADPTAPKGPCIYNVVINRCPIMCPLTGLMHFQPGKSTSESVFASGHSGCGGD
jgi:hypothetical protein